MIKKILTAAAILTLSIGLVACGSEGSSSTASSSASSEPPKTSTTANLKQIEKDIAQNPDIDKNAKVKTFVNEDGNAAFSYTNPDGSGGGGIAID